MARLSVKLAREAFFGVELMGKCTVAGQRGFDSLPEAQLYNLKLYLVQLFPLLNHAEFEDKWKDCLISIGQACKSIRSKNWETVLTCLISLGSWLPYYHSMLYILAPCIGEFIICGLSWLNWSSILLCTYHGIAQKCTAGYLPNEAMVGRHRRLDMHIICLCIYTRKLNTAKYTHSYSCFDFMDGYVLYMLNTFWCDCLRNVSYYMGLNFVFRHAIATYVTRFWKEFT